jgi:hypothetical protein
MPGTFLLSPWFVGPIHQVLWGWLLSPLMPDLLGEEEAADGCHLSRPPLPGQTAAGEDCLFAVDHAWAGALLAVGALSAANADRKRTTQLTPYRQGKDRSEQ